MYAASTGLYLVTEQGLELEVEVGVRTNTPDREPHPQSTLGSLWVANTVYGAASEEDRRDDGTTLCGAVSY